jgi:hypothetical protein
MLIDYTKRRAASIKDEDKQNTILAMVPPPPESLKKTKPSGRRPGRTKSETVQKERPKLVKRISRRERIAKSQSGRNLAASTTDDADDSTAPESSSSESSTPASTSAAVVGRHGEHPPAAAAAAAEDVDNDHSPSILLAHSLPKKSKLAPARLKRVASQNQRSFRTADEQAPAAATLCKDESEQSIDVATAVSKGPVSSFLVDSTASSTPDAAASVVPPTGKVVGAPLERRFSAGATAALARLGAALARSSPSRWEDKDDSDNDSIDLQQVVDNNKDKSNHKDNSKKEEDDDDEEQAIANDLASLGLGGIMGASISKIRRSIISPPEDDEKEEKEEDNNASEPSEHKEQEDDFQPAPRPVGRAEASTDKQELTRDNYPKGGAAAAAAEGGGNDDDDDDDDEYDDEEEKTTVEPGIELLMKFGGLGSLTGNSTSAVAAGRMGGKKGMKEDGFPLPFAGAKKSSAPIAAKGPGFGRCQTSELVKEHRNRRPSVLLETDDNDMDDEELQMSESFHGSEASFELPGLDGEKEEKKEREKETNKNAAAEVDWSKPSQQTCDWTKPSKPSKPITRKRGFRRSRSFNASLSSVTEAHGDEDQEDDEKDNRRRYSPERSHSMSDLYKKNKTSNLNKNDKTDNEKSGISFTVRRPKQTPGRAHTFDESMSSVSRLEQSLSSLMAPDDHLGTSETDNKFPQKDTSSATPAGGGSRLDRMRMHVSMSNLSAVPLMSDHSNKDNMWSMGGSSSGEHYRTTMTAAEAAKKALDRRAMLANNKQLSMGCLNKATTGCWTCIHKPSRAIFSKWNLMANGSARTNNSNKIINNNNNCFGKSQIMHHGCDMEDGSKKSQLESQQPAIPTSISICGDSATGLISPPTSPPSSKRISHPLQVKDPLLKSSSEHIPVKRISDPIQNPLSSASEHIPRRITDHIQLSQRDQQRSFNPRTSAAAAGNRSQSPTSGSSRSPGCDRRAVSTALVSTAFEYVVTDSKFGIKKREIPSKEEMGYGNASPDDDDVGNALGYGDVRPDSAGPKDSSNSGSQGSPSALTVNPLLNGTSIGDAMETLLASVMGMQNDMGELLQEKLALEAAVRVLREEKASLHAAVARLKTEKEQLEAGKITPSHDDLGYGKATPGKATPDTCGSTAFDNDTSLGDFEADTKSEDSREMGYATHYTDGDPQNRRGRMVGGVDGQEQSKGLPQRLDSTQSEPPARSHRRQRSNSLNTALGMLSQISRGRSPKRSGSPMRTDSTNYTHSTRRGAKFSSKNQYKHQGTNSESQPPHHRRRRSNSMNTALGMLSQDSRGLSPKRGGRGLGKKETSRRNLMSDRHHKDTSHFVTGSRIRRIGNAKQLFGGAAAF